MLSSRLVSLAFVLLISPLVAFGQLKYVAPPDPKKPDYSATPMQDWEKKFADFKFFTYEKEGHVLPFRFHQPDALVPGQKYPLVVFFHGLGERGADNRLQFFRFRDTVAFWEKYPCFVLAAQCFAHTEPGRGDGSDLWVNTGFGATSHTMAADPTWPLKMAMELIDRCISLYPVDTRRVYITGLSMGGYATWEVLQREGGKFAAAMPVCGGADLAFAGKIAPIPLWIFHGAVDTTVPPSRSRDMVEALKAAGGHPKYTEFPGVAHGAWSPAYSDPAIWDWLFSQHK